MTTVQPSFLQSVETIQGLNPCVASSASTATITVVTTTPQQSQQQQVISVVAHSPGIDSPSDSQCSCASPQVTAQVVVSSGASTHSSGGGNSACGTPNTPEQNSGGPSPATIVNSPQYIQVPEGNNARSYTSLTPVEPIVSEADAVGCDSVSPSVHSTYVHYVEGSTDPAIYAATNGQMAYPVYTVGETNSMYSPTSGQYYNTGNSTASVTYSQVASSLSQGSAATLANQSQLLTQGGGTYLIQQDADGNTLINAARASPHEDTSGVTYMVQTSSANTSLESADGHAGLSHATRVSPATVQWLLDNYETAEGVSLPRSTLYTHYLRHCTENKLDPVNAASFGKLIRSVFLGLRTRRLGTRGNSKYHYYGIRVKPSSPLNQILAEESTSTIRQQSSSQRRYRAGASPRSIDSHFEANCSGHNISGDTVSPQFLGDLNASITNLPDIDCASYTLEDGITTEDIEIFRNLYIDHCEALLEVVVNLQFNLVEGLWRQFWRTASSNNNNNGEMEQEKLLPKTRLYAICNMDAVQNFVQVADYQFYQNLVDILIPDVLRPIPSSLTQAIRNFAKGLEGWLTSSMSGCPEVMLQVKMAAVSAFSQTLRRYTSLNHLAQAARAVLQNSNQINQMLSDLNRVDFSHVQEQADWVCLCDKETVLDLQSNFKSTLQQQNSLEQWASWLEGVVQKVLKPYEGRPNFAKAARQFLLKWSFYSSMVIRDLTLRSAASFGSFHLIRLLYDEYMFYLVEHRVAAANGETPIAVIGEHAKEMHHPSSSIIKKNDCYELPSNSINGSIISNQDASSSSNISISKIDTPNVTMTEILIQSEEIDDNPESPRKRLKSSS